MLDRDDSFTTIARAFSTLVLIAGIGACSGRGSSDATGALAAPGTRIPPFSFPSIRGQTFDRSRLLLGHTLVALVAENPTGNEPELVEYDSLKRLNPMFRSAVVYNRGVEPRDTAYVNTPPWLAGSERGFASDSQLVAVFGRSGRGVLDDYRRAGLRLPSFLVVSDSGRVLARVAGHPRATLGPVLDSLRAVWDSTQAAEGAAEVARVKPRIERGVRSFDAATLVDSNAKLTMDATCGGEETVGRGIIPAVARLVEIRARHPGVVTTLDITSVAEVEPLDHDDVCQSKQVQLTPKLEMRRYRVDFFENLPDSSGPGELYLDMSIEALGDEGGNRRRALISLADIGNRGLHLPAGVTIDELRARIDSIRRAAP